MSAVSGLIASRPRWKLLIDFLSRHKTMDPVELAELWLVDAGSSWSGRSPDWAGLIDDLSTKIPFINSNGLDFQPMLLHLPEVLQHCLLQLMFESREEMSVVLLSDWLKVLLNSLDGTLLSDWTTVYIHFMVKYCMQSSTVKNGQASSASCYVDLFCEREETGVDFAKVAFHDATSYHFTKASSEEAAELTAFLGSEMSKNISEAHPGAMWSDCSSLVISGHNAACQMNKTVSCYSDSGERASNICGLVSSHPSNLSISQEACEIMDLVESADIEVCCEDIRKNRLSSLSADVLEKLEQLKVNWKQGVVKCDMSVLHTLDHQQLQQMFEESSATLSSDVALSAACQNMVEAVNTASYGVCQAFAHQCISQRVLHLELPASRILTSALITFAKAFPRHIAEEVLLPAVSFEKASSVSADLLIKLIRDVYVADKKLHLLSCLLTAPVLWSENTVPILQLLLDAKLDLTDAELKALVTALSLNGASATHASSAKFGKLLLTAVNVFSNRMDGVAVQQLITITDHHTSFMKKPLQNLLLKLTPAR